MYLGIYDRRRMWHGITPPAPQFFLTSCYKTYYFQNNNLLFHLFFFLYLTCSCPYIPTILWQQQLACACGYEYLEGRLMQTVVTIKLYGYMELNTLNKEKISEFI